MCELAVSVVARQAQAELVAGVSLLGGGHTHDGVPAWHERFESQPVGHWCPSYTALST
jgi:hypothetical protein